MDEPVRVLQVMASLDRGGAEAVVMDWLRRIDRRLVTFDFVVNDDQALYAYELEAENLGARVIRAPRFKLINLPSYTAWWWRTLKGHPEWTIIHAHHTVPAFAILSVARVLGRVAIAHSHIAGRDNSLAGVARTVLRWPLRHVAEVTLACSGLAASWMFGRRRSATIIPNGVDLERFAFDLDARDGMRRELGMNDAIIVGHVGSFSKQKNHLKVLQVFGDIWAVESQARLLLVGDGGLRPQIEAEIEARGLRDVVMLAGVRSDVPALLGAMDVLLFPSKYEGLPVALVEAQASGLPCVASSTITREVAATERVWFVSLAAPNRVWVQTVLEAARKGNRRSATDQLSSAGFGAGSSALKMQEIYVALSSKLVGG